MHLLPSNLCLDHNPEISGSALNSWFSIWLLFPGRTCLGHLCNFTVITHFVLSKVKILPWFLANTSKFVTKVNVKIIIHNVIHFPHHHLSNRISHRGQFTVSHEWSECGVAVLLCLSYWWTGCGCCWGHSPSWEPQEWGCCRSEARGNDPHLGNHDSEKKMLHCTKIILCKL